MKSNSSHEYPRRESYYDDDPFPPEAISNLKYAIQGVLALQAR